MSNMNYPINELSREKQREFFIAVKPYTSKWWFDKLDCAESFCRRLIPDATFEQALETFDNNHSALSSFIVREKTCPAEDKHFEIGYRAMSVSVDYFLYMIVSEPEFDAVVAIFERLHAENDSKSN